MFVGEVTRSTNAQIRLPSWGRCFWQDPTDGSLFVAFASGNNISLNYSLNSGVAWTNVTTVPVDNFSVHDNFDLLMDRRGDLHLLYRVSDQATYRFVDKTSIGNYSVGSALSFTSVADTGNVGGVNGSLFMDEAGPITTFPVLETATDFPLLRIVVKDNNNDVRAYYSQPSYTSVVEDVDGSALGIHQLAVRSAGLNGGFPIIYRYTDGFNADGLPGVVFFCEPSGSMEFIVRNTVGNQWTYNGTALPDTVRNTFDPAISGVAIISGLAPPGPMMAFGSGIGPAGHIILGNDKNIQTLYSMESEIIIGPGGNDDVFNIGPRIANDIRSSVDPAPFGSGNAFANGRTILGVGGNSQSPVVTSSGGYTRCDFSFTDRRDEIKFYFQDINELNGRQVIKRVLSSQLAGQSGASPTWQFASRQHIESGVKTLAEVNPIYCGGSGTPSWTHFKALRHPTEPGDGASAKKEMLCMVGQTPAVPTATVDGWLPGTVSIFDIDKHLAVDFPYPSFSLDYTKTSGDAVGLVDVTSFGWGETNNLFDDNLLTYSPLDNSWTNGDRITLEFSKPIMVDRIEMLKANTAESGFGDINLPSFDIETSFDGTTFTPYKQNLLMLTNFLSNNLIKTHPIDGPAFGPSAVTNPPDPAVTHNIQPIIGKYIRFTKNSTSNPFAGPMREIRLYGPAQTQGKIYTFGNVSERLRFTGPMELFNTEEFHVRHGELPAELQTLGDFNWFTSASGTWAKAADLPGVIPSSVGIVTNGFWTGQSVGLTDGFAATIPALAPNAGSGVMRGIVTVDPGEFFGGGTFNGRVVNFDYRLDMHNDDEFEFTTFSTVENQPPYGNFFQNPTSQVLWTGRRSSYTTTPDVLLPPGKHMLQWEYRRGSQTNSTSAGAVWVDNIRGLDGQPQPSIRGFTRGTNPGASGAVHGYSLAHDITFISSHGFASGGMVAEAVHGYTSSTVQPDIISSINGYTNATVAESVHGFLFGNNFLTKTFPTGEIKGYVQTESGITSSVHGYVRTMVSETVHGYLQGFDIETFAAHGYVDSFDVVSQIHGIVNASGDNTVLTSVHGFVQSRFGIGDQVVHGFVSVPSGFVSNRKGYTQGWVQNSSFFRPPQTMIHAHVLCRDLESFTSHGYVSGNFPAGRRFGYLQGEFIQSGVSQVHGFVKQPPAIFTSVHGYVSAGDFNSQVHGYVSAGDFNSQVHGYINASFTSSINGYLFAVSGIPAESIHGYIKAVEIPTSMIFGNTLGTLDVSVGGDPCPTHNFPLSPVPTVTIPTGNFFN